MTNSPQKDKILIIDRCVDVVGGVERVICTIANELVGEYDIEILSEEKLVDESFFQYKKSIQKAYLYDRASGILCNKFQEGLLQSLNELFIKTMIKLTRRHRIRKFLKSHADVKTIVFGRTTIALHFLPIIKKLNFPAKVIVRDAIHLLYLSPRKQKKILKFFPGLVDTFIVSSKESKRAYEELFHGANIKIVKIYNPLAIQPRQEWDFKNKQLVAIGRLDDAQKGFDVLLPAFKIVQQKHPDWKLTIYGGGKEAKNLKGHIGKYNLKNTELRNFTPDVVKTFDHTSIFVFPSRYEGYANTLVEALACGIPSVTFDWLMGADEIIQNNKNGIIIPLQNRFAYYKGSINASDITNLANVLCYLIEHKTTAERFAQNAPKIIKSRSKNKVIAEWKRLIQNQSTQE